jgi:hypothetical protein
MACSFARIRCFIVRRKTRKVPLALPLPQMCVNPRKSKVSGFPTPRSFRDFAAKRPNSIKRVLAG